MSLPDQETRDLLSRHETIAVFTGYTQRPCRFMTALCPDRCGHAATTADFEIRKYLNYTSPEGRGDKEAKAYHWDTRAKGPASQAEFVSQVEQLHPDDLVLLSWDHEYVHRGGSHFPERPIAKLAKLTAEEAQQMLEA